MSGIDDVSDISESRPKLDAVGLASRWPALMLLVIAPFAPLFAESSRIMSKFVLITVFVVAANSVALVMRLGRITAVAQGAFVGVGAYTAGHLSERLGLGFWVALPVASAVTALVAGIVGYPSFRARGLYFLMVTFAFAEFFVLAADNFDFMSTTKFSGASSGVVISEMPRIGGFTFDTREELFYLFLAFAYASVVIIWLIERSRFGKRCIAIRDNEALAEALGTSTRTYKVLLFMVGGAIAGVAGVLWLYHFRSITPGQFGGFASLLLMQMVVIGGATYLGGAAFGAVFVVLLPELIGIDATQEGMIIGATVVIAVLLLRKGIVGTLQSTTRYALSSRDRRGSRRVHDPSSIRPDGGLESADSELEGLVR